ncbi:hypothetical protein D3C75_1197340 [compost metagenome]
MYREANFGSHGRMEVIMGSRIFPSICTLPRGNALFAPALYQSLRARVFWKVTLFLRRGSTASMNVLLCTM